MVSFFFIFFIIEKKFKDWPGYADDLFSNHRDADGNWVTEAVGGGKWAVCEQTNTGATSHSALATLPGVRSARGAGKRAVSTPTRLGKRPRGKSALPVLVGAMREDERDHSDQAWDSDFEDTEAKKKQRQKSRTSRTLKRKRSEGDSPGGNVAPRTTRKAK